MTDTPSPMPDQNSTPKRKRSWRFAVSAVACGVALGLLAWAAIYCWSEHARHQARAVVSGEEFPPPPAPPEPAVEPAPEVVPEAVPAPAAAPSGSAAGTKVDEPATGGAFIERFDREDISDRWFISDGWANGSWLANDWRREAVEAGDGMLSLNLKPGPKGSDYELTGGEIRTHDFRKYGYFEVRMKVPKGAGLVSGVFSYADRAKGVKPNEIDIEILGKNTRAAELTIHEGGRATSKIVQLAFDASEGFHTYGFDWQPAYVRWYIDGRVAHEETSGAARRVVRPQQLIMNMWGSRELSAWTGQLDTKKAPWKLEFSCVAYARAYTGALCN